MKDNNIKAKQLSIFFILLFVLSGCSLKQKVNHSKGVFFTIKTPNLKYSDSGFVRKIEDKINIELFSAGIPVLSIYIDKKICLNRICYNKSQFNSQFLGDMHYNNILEDIVLFQPIYNNKNLKHQQNGFTQSLHVKKREIFYKVTQKSVTFRDKEKKVLIKIRKLREKN